MTSGIINVNCTNDNKGLAWVLAGLCAILNISFVVYMFKHLD